MSEQNLYPLEIIPLTRHYVWGGHRLKKYFTDFENDDSPLAEVWLIGEDVKFLRLHLGALDRIHRVVPEQPFLDCLLESAV